MVLKSAEEGDGGRSSSEGSMVVEIRPHPDQVCRPTDEPDDVSETGGWSITSVPGDRVKGSDSQYVHLSNQLQV